jgi:hypothetical protein
LYCEKSKQVAKKCLNKKHVNVEFEIVDVEALKRKGVQVLNEE